MIRDLDRLTARTFDVLVVGGGIYGLTIAYDAAQRGLSVALIERDDFGGGSVVQSSPDDPRRSPLSADARHRPRARIGAGARARSRASRRTRSGRCPSSLPLYRSLIARQAGDARRLSARSTGRRSIATAACPPSHRLPAGRVVSRGDAAQRFPGLRRQGLTGAAVWHDYVTTESDRLTFTFALAADEHGAVLANHVEAIAPARRRPARHRRARARPRIGSRARHRRAPDGERHRRRASIACSRRSASRPDCRS